jgi:hypothetical protein
MRCAMNNNATLRRWIRAADGGAHRSAGQGIACEAGD